MNIRDIVGCLDKCTVDLHCFIITGNSRLFKSMLHNIVISADFQVPVRIIIVVNYKGRDVRNYFKCNWIGFARFILVYLNTSCLLSHLAMDHFHANFLLAINLSSRVTFFSVH